MTISILQFNVLICQATWVTIQSFQFPFSQATGVTTARGHDLSDHPQFAKGDNSINIRDYCQFARKEERVNKETL